MNDTWKSAFGSLELIEYLNNSRYESPNLSFIIVFYPAAPKEWTCSRLPTQPSVLVGFPILGFSGVKKNKWFDEVSIELIWIKVHVFDFKFWLVGGGFNPFEKYARQIWSFPQIGVNINHIQNHHLDLTWGFDVRICELPLVHIKMWFTFLRCWPHCSCGKWPLWIPAHLGTKNTGRKTLENARRHESLAHLYDAYNRIHQINWLKQKMIKYSIAAKLSNGFNMV